MSSGFGSFTCTRPLRASESLYLSCAPDDRWIMSSATRTFIFVALLCLLITHELQICEGQQPSTDGNQIDCGAECNRRCSEASRHKMCTRACNTCCNRCSCVPPGTSGGLNACPCYANMTTHGGRRKCP